MGPRAEDCAGASDSGQLISLFLHAHGQPVQMLKRSLDFPVLQGVTIKNGRIFSGVCKQISRRLQGCNPGQAAL